MKALQQEIKEGIFHRAYLFCGEEDYLKRQYKERLIQAMLPDGDTVNFARYTGKDAAAGEIIDLAETMPFFAERRLILIEDCGLFRGGDSPLAAYIEQIPETACLLFVEPGSDTVDKRSKMYKALNKHGRVVSFDRQDDATLARWVQQRAAKDQLAISKATASYLLNYCGTQMDVLDQEMEKLFSYARGQQEVTTKDIEAICTRHLENRIFDMIDAVSARDQTKTLARYRELVALREPPMRILALLVRQFRNLLGVKDMARLGKTQQQMAEELGLRPFVIRKMLGYANAFSSGELKEAMRDCLELDEAIKTGEILDTLAVETFLIKYSNKGQRGNIRGSN